MGNSIDTYVEIQDYAIARAFENDGELMASVLNEMRSLDDGEIEQFTNTLNDQGREVFRQLYEALVEGGER